MKHRLLYLPLGEAVDAGIGFTVAFEKLVQSGEIEALKAVQFCREVKDRGGWDCMLEHVMKTAIDFRPTAIMWQLQTTGEVPAAFVRQLRSLPAQPVIIQFTGDSYRRPPRNMVRFGREIDATVLHGTTHVPGFERAGCHDVRFLTHWFHTEQWCKPWSRTNAPEFDVVMIVNNYRQLPFKRYEGQSDRVELAKAFGRRYGARFAIYGNGWEGHPCAHGFIPNARQPEVMHNAWLILAANNWHHAHYFSDRLPISLASRVPVLHKWFEGADDYFQDGRHLWWFRDTAEALSKADAILSLREEERNRIAQAGADEAFRNHSCDRHARRFLQMFDELYERRHSQLQAG